MTKVNGTQPVASQSCDFCRRKLEHKEGRFSKIPCGHKFHRTCLSQWRKSTERLWRAHWGKQQSWSSYANKRWDSPTRSWIKDEPTVKLYCPQCNASLATQSEVNAELKAAIKVDKVDEVARALLKGARFPSASKLVDKGNLFSLALTWAGPEVKAKLEEYHPLFRMKAATIRQRYVELLKKEVEECPNKTQVYLSLFDLGPWRGEIIREVMNESPSDQWTSIEFGPCDAREPHFSQICQGIETMPELKRLAFDRAWLDEDAMHQLMKSVNMNPTIHRLNLTSCHLGDSGAFVAASLLEAQAEDEEGVKLLVLSGNDIGEEGAFYLSSALAVNGVLEYLELDDNKIDAAGAGHFGYAIRHNTTIDEFSLCNNPLGNDGCIAIFDALAANKQSSVRRVYLEDVEMTDPAMEHLLRLRDENPHMEAMIFYLKDNRLSEDLKKKAEWMSEQGKVMAKIENLPPCFQDWVTHQWTTGDLTVDQVNRLIQYGQWAMEVANFVRVSEGVEVFKRLLPMDQNKKIPALEPVKDWRNRDFICDMARHYLEMEETEAEAQTQNDQEVEGQEAPTLTIRSPYELSTAGLCQKGG